MTGGRIAYYAAGIPEWFDNATANNCDADCNVTFTDVGASEKYLMISRGDGGNYWDHGPPELTKRLTGRAKTHPPVEYISTGTMGRYYCLFANGAAIWNTAGCDELDEILDEATGVTCVAFGQDIDTYVVLSAGQKYWGGLDDEFDRYVRDHDLQTVALNPTNSSYLAIHSDNDWFGIISPSAKKQLGRLASNEYVKSAWLGIDNTYVFHIVTIPAPVALPPVPAKKPSVTISIPSHIATKCEDHRMYVGELLRGIRHGSGTTTYTDGFQWNWFVGNHANGFPLKGIVSASDGGMYSGELTSLDSAVYNGWGSLMARNESWSSGQFKGGKLHGVGLHVYPDGRWTMGWFENGKRHGRALTFYDDKDDRRYFLGQYCYDDFDTSTSQLAYMNCSMFTGNAKDERGSTTNARLGSSRWNRVFVAPSEVTFLEGIVAGAIQLTGCIPEHCRSETGLSAPWRGVNEAATPALKNFLRGLRLLKEVFGDQFAQHWSEGCFSWHGTPKVQSASDIVTAGFNTKCRDRQNHGPGEYAATSWQAALPFAQHSSRLVLCYSLPGPFLTSHPSFCTVTCNPPSSKGVSFMLPVAVVQFTEDAKFNTAPPKQGVWQFLWEGTGTGAKWHPYHPVINDQLTALSDAGGEHVVSVAQRRHDDALVDTYEIRMGGGAHRQVNTRTDYKRNVKEIRTIPAYPTMRAVPAPVFGDGGDDEDYSRSRQRRRK